MGDEMMSLTEFRAWLAERGVKRSKAELYRRAAKKREFGQKVGSQWVVAISEAQVSLESFRLKDS